MFASFESGATAGGGGQNILLFLDTTRERALGLLAPPALPPAWLHQPSRLRLIVLDGTWRKSRKMLFLSPPLQKLPRLSLRGLPPSNYRIRKARHPDQLSTLEATCAALTQLERQAENFQALLTAFDVFLAQQLGYLARD